MASTSTSLPLGQLSGVSQSGTEPARTTKIAVGARKALSLWKRKQAVFVDLRDWETMDRTGWIEGAMHCPPGEFANIISPESPLHARLFEPGRVFIFYGGAKSGPLACARRARALGLANAFAMRGGLRSWREAGGPLNGHPDSPLPALKASALFAYRHAKRRVEKWWRARSKTAQPRGRVATGG